MQIKFPENADLNFYNLLGAARKSNAECHIICASALAQGRLQTGQPQLLVDFVSSLKGKTAMLHSQLLQDAFADFVAGGIENRTFLEFGATDGLELSNSAGLEQHFGWTGCLCEPSPQWHAALQRNRPNTKILTDCVWTETGQTLDFFVSDIGELSTLDAFRHGDAESMSGNTEARNAAGHTVSVNTISLMELVEQHFGGIAPTYMSVDTEGSELAILREFDFSQYRPIVLTVEHNFTPGQASLDELFAANNYTRVLRELTFFDAWYVSNEQLAKL